VRAAQSFTRSRLHACDRPSRDLLDKPRILEYGVELWPADRKEVERDPQHQAGVVEPERPEPDAFVESCTFRRSVAQAEIHQPNGQQPERTEQRGMRMVM
jgi:hypothetical protein